MRISSLLPTNSNYTSKNAKMHKNNDEITATKKDTVDISSNAKDFQSVLTSLASDNDVRVQKVDNIKSQLENGTYKISIDDVAEKMLSL